MTAPRISKRILLGCADALAAPEVVWSLTEAGHEVILVVGEGRPAALEASRLVTHVTVPDPAKGTAAAIAGWEAAVKKYKPDVAMPLDDGSLWIVDQLEGIDVIGACGKTAELALDKRLQVAAAKAAGMAVPETFELDRDAINHEHFPFPWILKPALAAVVKKGELSRGKFAFANSSEDVEGALAKISSGQPYLVQPVHEGIGEGVFGIAIDGEAYALSGHRRVRMMNPAGSGSSACTAREVEPKIERQVRQFLKDIRWEGLFMVEFLRDAEGTAWFMEINGRPWGSMALARRRGHEYPAWAIDAHFDNFKEPEKTGTDSIVCRHVAREIIHVAMVFRGRGRGLSKGKTLRDVIAWKPEHRLYNWEPRDPTVFFADVANGLGLAALWRIVYKCAVSPWRKIRFRLRKIAARSRGGNTRACEAARDAKSVLFVCYGNINRSAVAHRLLVQKNISGLTADSCGFHPVVGRDADSTMVEVAQENGINMKGWSSQQITRQQVDAADLILAMDASHIARLRDRFPDCLDKTFYFSSIDTKETIPLEVGDPFAKERTTYETCFSHLERGISSLVSLRTSS